MSIRTLAVSFAATLFATMIVLTSPANATVLLYESFDYTTGTLNGKGPGEDGFSGAWNGATNYTVQPGTLTFPAGTNFTPQGNSARTTGAASNVQIFQPMTSGINFSAPGTYYASFLVNKHDISQPSGEFFWLGLSNSGDSSRKALWGLGSTEAVLLGSDNTGSGFSISSTGFINGNETYLYTAKITTTASGNDTYNAKLYAFSTDTIPSTEPVTWDVTHTNAVSGIANQLEWFTGINSNYTLDEFRFGQTWLDVAQGPVPPPIPEPSSIALLALGLIGLISRRRHARRA